MTLAVGVKFFQPTGELMNVTDATVAIPPTEGTDQ